MNIALYIARRYLFSKKSTNAINIISGISTLGVFVGSAALIIILSVFNGFEQLVLSLYNSSSPDLKIYPAEGKTFDPNSEQFGEVKSRKDIISYTEVLQEKALIRYDNLQFIGQVKGVSDDFLKNPKIDSSLVEGEFLLREGDKDFAVIGTTVRYTLGVNVNSMLKKIELYSPVKGRQSAFIPAEEFVSRSLAPVGVFQAQQEENDMVIIPLKEARSLLSEPKNVSAVEIFLKDADSAQQVQKQLQKILGKAYLIKDRVQQNALLYKILNSEKWAVFLILTFVLIIAIFNIIGSLTMLVIDKRRDIAILNSLGATKNLVSRIFLAEGMMISLIGCFAGMIAGALFCVLQIRYGLIHMGGGNLLVQAYPVELKAADFLLVFSTVLVISFIASFISSRLSIKGFNNLKERL